MATKLEILRNYKAERDSTGLLGKSKVRDTWHALGEATIENNSKVFNKDMIYRLKVHEDNQTQCPLYGSLVYCQEDVYGIQDWNNFKLLDSRTGESSFGHNIISPSFITLLTGFELDEVEDEKLWMHEGGDPYKPVIIDHTTGKPKKTEMNNIYSSPDEDFIPFQEEFKKTGEVQISELDYQNCIKCLGYPFITEEELEYPRQDILNLAIKPALEEYFHWLPRTRIEEVPVTGQVQLIPFPSDAYDICGIQVQQRGTHGAGSIQHPLWRFADESAYGSFNTAGLTGTYRGPNRPHTNVSSMTNFIDQRAVSQAVTNLNTRVHYDKVYLYQDSDGNIYEDVNKIPGNISVKEAPALRVYSNKLGNFNIHWAIHSLNFDDVMYEQRQNMFKYCQAEVMLLFANLRRQARSDIPGAIDYSGWISEANTMKQEVTNEWKQLVKASLIMRGSL